jgi:hypothetical protein
MPISGSPFRGEGIERVTTNRSEVKNRKNINKNKFNHRLHNKIKIQTSPSLWEGCQAPMSLPVPAERSSRQDKILTNRSY